MYKYKYNAIHVTCNEAYKRKLGFTINICCIILVKGKHNLKKMMTNYNIFAIVCYHKFKKQLSRAGMGQFCQILPNVKLFVRLPADTNESVSLFFISIKQLDYAV